MSEQKVRGQVALAALHHWQKAKFSEPFRCRYCGIAYSDAASWSACPKRVKERV